MTVQANANLQIFRVLRVLRPLRSINRIPNLKGLVETVLGALEGLVDVVYIIGFLFLCYALLGVQLFEGNLLENV